MKTVSPYAFRSLLGLSAMSAITVVIAWATGGTSWMGPSVTACFLSLALAASMNTKLQNVNFALWIGFGVALAMSFPDWFIGVGDFEFTSLFVPILQVIMFGMGITLSVADFARVFKMPTGVLIGVTCQYTIMPLIGFVLAKTFGFPPEIAAGLVLVGVSPSGLSSNVMTYIAKANLAMSVTITAASTLLAPILTPLLMRLLAGEMIEIDVPAMMRSITKIVLLPVLGGLVFHHTIYHWFKSIDKVMPMISMLGIFIMTVLTVAIGRDNLLQMGVPLIAACFIHCIAGFVLGYGVCRVLGMDELTCRTISLEVGLQNSGMASGIAKELNRVATVGLAPIVFGPVMTTTSSIIANRWRNRPVDAPTQHRPPASSETRSRKASSGNTDLEEMAKSL